ncbi:SDR family NAD(P)-dependent oxidoreductase [Brevibacillus sp. SYSU BS000544]|uniref:SDR family NAD(P)-dependent oxidoreductase n=1 Tax=Brevibacillus sp. SYSU BS000544 TaxID=3416443 RepID=UPI003CE479DF
MKFASKVAVITGAGRGIGKHLSIRYAQEGAQVIVAEKNTVDGNATVSEINEAGGQAVFYRTDVSDPASIINLFQNVQSQYGRVDILINNAGFGIWKSPYDLSLDEWDSVVNTNLRGTFLCSREAARIMKENGGGSIVMLSSTRAHMSEPNSEAYAASKGGILSLTHSLAVSLGPDRIRVNAISPGWIETGDYDALRTEDHLQHLAQRVGRPEDIAKACFYLTHDNNDFVTGTELFVDGGMTRKMIYIP